LGRVSEASVLEPLRRSTRNTLLFTVLTFGLLPAFVMTNSHPRPVQAGILLGGIAGFLGMHGFRLWRAVRGRWEPLPLWQTTALLVYVMALTVYAVSIGVDTGIMCTLLTGLAVTEFVIGRRRGEAWRYIAIASVVQGVVFGTAVFALGKPETAFLVGLLDTGIVAVTAYSITIAFRQWERTLDLDKARQQAAELATTKERLRLAEDLHDILGHALEVVSFKSELAVRLGPIDPERSQAEMAEVQRLARGALQDVRALAHGNRPTDLDTELVGARKLLTSAGISCDFAAEPDGLTSERELLGRVLREAVTNLLRHADAHTCRVTLEVGKREATLRVVNDGVPPVPAESAGSGLTGLARRVREAGGTFHARAVEPRSFEVVATVPVGAA
jgi:two-component system sensor histidine kinase DesK